MAENVPDQYLITIEDENWLAEYAGSGAVPRFPASQAAERYDVPEGTLMVSGGLNACQLVTGPDTVHYYRLRKF